MLCQRYLQGFFLLFALALVYKFPYGTHSQFFSVVYVCFNVMNDTLHNVLNLKFQYVFFQINRDHLQSSALILRLLIHLKKSYLVQV